MDFSTSYDVTEQINIYAEAFNLTDATYSTHGRYGNQVLDVVDYVGDNWLRCWFANIDPITVAVTTPKKLERWQQAMTEASRPIYRR